MFNLTSPLKYYPMSSGNTQIVYLEHINAFSIYVDGHSWMGYAMEDHWQAKEFYFEIAMAKGVCITTGLGLGVLQTNLCLKPEVSKVIVYERSSEVIDLFHKTIELNKFDISKLEIRQGDADNIEGEVCDCLFPDHFDIEPQDHIINIVRGLSKSNQASVVWYWPAVFHFLLFVISKNLPIDNNSYQLWKNFTEIENLPETIDDTIVSYFKEMDSVVYRDKLAQRKIFGIKKQRWSNLHRSLHKK